MFNNIFQTTLTGSSIITYLSSLILLFNITPVSEHIEALFLRDSPNSEPLVVFSSIIILLILPNLIAAISYRNSSKNRPDMNQQPSARFRVLVDLILIAPIIWFLYIQLLTPNQNHQSLSPYILQPSNIPFYMGAALVLSLISLVIFQPLRFVTNVYSEEETQQYLKSLIDKPPYIDFHVHAYHHEWRTRYVTETHTVNGRSETRTRTETYQEQVTTLQLSKPYEMVAWQDTTNQSILLIPQQFRITKIKISTIISAADTRTKEHYNQAWSDFRNEYKNADAQVDFSTTKGIRGMGPKRLLSFLNLEEKSILLNGMFCTLIALTPCAWGYSLWLDQMSSVTEKTISKEYLLSS